MSKQYMKNNKGMATYVTYLRRKQSGHGNLCSLLFNIVFIGLGDKTFVPVPLPNPFPAKKSKKQNKKKSHLYKGDKMLSTDKSE